MGAARPRGEPRNLPPAWLHSGDLAGVFDPVERARLSDLFDELGPQAPTLLAPCTTRDLAAHLVLRERDYLPRPGLVLPGGRGRFADRQRTPPPAEDVTLLTPRIR